MFSTLKSTFFTLCTLIFCASSILASPQLVVNGSFEQGLKGWNLAPGRGNPGLETRIVNSGRNSLRIQTDKASKGAKVEGELVACAAPGDVELRFRGMGISGQNLTLYVRQYAADRKQIIRQDGVTLNFPHRYWRDMGLRFKLHENTAYLQPWILAYPAEGEKIEWYVDDIVIRRVSPRRAFTGDTGDVVTIDPSKSFQKIEGWGGNIYRNIMAFVKDDPDYWRKALKELKTTHMRIVTQTYFFEKVNDNDDPDVINWETIEKHIPVWLKPEFEMLKILQDHGVKLLHATFRLPNWMIDKPKEWKFWELKKDSYYLRQTLEAEYVEHIFAYLLYAKKNYGVTFEAVSIANEPMHGGYIAMSPDQYDRIQAKLAERLEKEGYRTRFYGPEPYTMNPYWSEQIFRYASTRKHVSSLSYHCYGRTTEGLIRFKELAENMSKPVWVTEQQAAESGTVAQGKTWKSALDNAICLQDILVYGNASMSLIWCYAAHVEQNVFSFYDGKENSWSPTYHMLKHFYNEIPVGSKRVLSSHETGAIRASAWALPGGQHLTLVLVNTSKKARSMNLNLAGQKIRPISAKISDPKKRYENLKLDTEGVELPAQSVLSLKIKLK